MALFLLPQSLCAAVRFEPSSFLMYVITVEVDTPLKRNNVCRSASTVVLILAESELLPAGCHVERGHVYVFEVLLRCRLEKRGSEFELPFGLEDTLVWNIVLGPS